MVWKREIPNRHARAYLRSAAPVKHQLKSDPNVSVSSVLFLGAKSSSPVAGHLPLAAAEQSFSVLQQSLR